MAVKIYDTMTTASDGFPLAYAEKINVKRQDGSEDNLQNLFNNGELSGGGGASYITLSQEEYDVLSDEEKVNGSEYRTYDTGHIYKLGIEYGKDGVQISDNETVEDKTWSSKKTSSKIAEVETELNAKVDKTDIATTIDSTSTDDTVPTAKAVNELNLRGTRIDQSVIDKYGTEILKYPLGRWCIDGNEIAGKFSDIPWRAACIIDITSIVINTKNPWDNQWSYRNYKVQTIQKKGNFVRQLESRGTPGVLVDTGWQRVCTTTVADVSMTTVSLDSSKFSNGSLRYEVKNGMCHVYINKLTPTDTFNSYNMSSTPMPKPSGSLVTCPIISDSNGVVIGLFYIDTNYNSTPRCNMFRKDYNGYATFSYPVAES